MLAATSPFTAFIRTYPGSALDVNCHPPALLTYLGSKTNMAAVWRTASH